ncbi:ArsR/SmtB family transcription factor [Paractinoplanes hotanensis]|uniref:Metalloregulator ArsR/SmtB family transcription factor n=1 Tax=Paractinoplanes hotanensis TaxID=2906497 RepID=A0ABT0YAJ0_9ACTN|nr:metalloregulator ArsR/SmtB family transcription factor [Actinoplanes hotanensis]MCM4083053.1 metalloregulator ArsR/SmtB family transcription factor [Actinoplanes hotanensis]
MPAARTRPVNPADCAADPAGPPLARVDAEQLARLFKALSDPTRLQILSVIEASTTGEACVCDLTEPFSMTQPAISHHLRTLVDAGLLNRDKRGSWAWYSLVPDRVAFVRDLLPGSASQRAAA